MTPDNPHDSGGRSGELHRPKIAPHYTGRESSLNGGPPRDRGTGWRVTPLRLAIGAAAAIVVIAALGLLRSDEVRSSESLSPAEVRAAGPAAISAEGVERLEVVGGETVGGSRVLDYDFGDTIRLWVDSDTAGVITIGGYDVSQPVEAGGRATFELLADIDGVQEVGFEDGRRRLAAVRVRP